MTNNLVGDVYQKVIEEVVAESTRDFEESGVGSTTLGELQQEWQSKLSQRGVAQMPWDPKPAPQPSPKPPTTAPTANNPSSSNNLPPSSYSTYEQPPSTATANGPRIKTEPDVEPQYAGMQGGYPQAAPPQGGAARAQQLVQEQFGPNAINGMQRGGGGLALPGGQQQHPQQQQQQAKPQGLQLPAGSPHPGQQQQQQHLSPQQQQQQAMQRQQQQLQQQQAQPRIKVENDNPSYQQQHQQQRQYQQQQQQPPSNYGQTDGGGDDVEDPHEQWQRMLAERRAIAAEHGRQADRMMREHVMQSSDALQNGLMVPMNEQPGKSRKRKAKAIASSSAVSTSAAPTIPQLDGDVDDEESKTGIKEEDDENAINSDLDDSDEEAQGNMGDDDDDGVDSILCTYDKVQRVKNKWKCILKDGVMNVGGKEWVFHKGTGEFEW